MQERGWFLSPNKGLVHEDDVGTFVGEKKPIGRTARLSRTRPPITRRSSTSPIAGGSPGLWNDLKAWWSKLPSWQKGVVIGVPVIAGIAVAAAAGKGEGKAGLEKI